MTHSNTVLHQMPKYIDRDSSQTLSKGHFPPIHKDLTMIRPGQLALFLFDGLVKSTQKGHSNPIYFVVGFLKLLDIQHVWSRNFKKHYASYIKLFPEPSENFEHTFYETALFKQLKSRSSLQKRRFLDVQLSKQFSKHRTAKWR